MAKQSTTIQHVPTVAEMKSTSEKRRDTRQREVRRIAYYLQAKETEAALSKTAKVKFNEELKKQ
jgi:hypothetical protein